MPPALFRAAHRDDGCRLFPQQHRGVEHPVLLGAEELFTVDYQQGLVRIVHHDQLRHMTSLVNLTYDDQFGFDGLLEDQVIHKGPGLQKQGVYRNVPELLGLA
ncbi:MAG: hypothetical protein BWX92_03023 [Deltaproteobacteria bacterium ADurb.Bin135]|nr:MAG: hypothetical protein BWX92_03023 [Deltaproteobacteria bacterium ADurb.Bin135]